MGDAEKGKIMYKRVCATCHTTEPGGRHKVGPNLFGVYGRTCGTTPGYKFSRVMQTKGIVWDDKALDAYLESPAKYMPGTRMVAYVGTKNKEDRQNVIAYLKTLK